MTKDSKVTLKLESKTALDLLQILDASTVEYSKEYPPERIVRLRNLMSQLDSEMEKTLL